MPKPVRMQQIEEDRGESIEQLIRRMVESGWTQEQIARDLGVNYWTLRTWLLRLGASFETTVRFASEEASVR